MSRLFSWNLTLLLVFISSEGLVSSPSYAFKQIDLDQLLTDNKCKHCDLREANLIGVNIEKADLQGANLQGANLLGSRLTGANLQGANLQGANLGGSVIEKANLQGANLTKTDLTISDFKGANLQGANFTGAKLVGTDFTGANLANAENVNFQSESPIILPHMGRPHINQFGGIHHYRTIQPQKLRFHRGRH